MKTIYGWVNVSHPNNSATSDRTIFALLQNSSKGFCGTNDKSVRFTYLAV